MSRYLFKIAFSLMAMLLPVLNSVSTAQLPAFPGAAGFGSHTPGGRGGKVIEVTNLKESGPGSLRSACEAAGPRIIIFKTGGTIKLVNKINITNPYITIAGQTAPGDGICIRGATLSVQTHDVIIRCLRFRAGDDPEGPVPDERDGLSVDNKNGGVRDVIIDHCSISWAVDENFQVWYEDARDITLSNSIISEALYRSIHEKGPHSMGGVNGQLVKNISYIGNLYAHNNERNVRIQGEVAFINNVVYNRRNKDVDIGETSNPERGFPRKVSVVGNNFIKGPDYNGFMYSVNVRDCPPGSAVYVSDNLSDYTSGDIFNKNPFMVSYPPVWPEDFKARPSSTVLEMVISGAGAIAPGRDIIDRRIINDLKNRSGKIIDCVSSDEIIRLTGKVQGGSDAATLALEDTQERRKKELNGYKVTITSGTGAGQTRTITFSERASNIIKISPEWNKTPDTSSRYKIYCDCANNAGGWPEYAPGMSQDDKDKDGIPDSWERSHKLNPADPSDGNQTNISKEGYTNIEVYINSLVSSD